MSPLLTNVNLTTLTVHNLVDKEMSKLDKVCRKGCNTCCHQIVDTLTWRSRGFWISFPRILTESSAASYLATSPNGLKCLIRVRPRPALNIH